MEGDGRLCTASHDGGALHTVDRAAHEKCCHAQGTDAAERASRRLPHDGRGGLREGILQPTRTVGKVTLLSLPDASCAVIENAGYTCINEKEGLPKKARPLSVRPTWA